MYLILAILFTACSVTHTTHFNKYNTYKYATYIYYTNDSLKLSIRYPGDYIFEDTFSKHHALTQNQHLGKYFKKKHFVFANKTKEAPFLESILFAIPQNKLNINSIPQLNYIPKNDATTPYPYYELANPTTFTIYRLYPYHEKDMWLIYGFRATNKFHFFNIKEFSDKILPSMRLGTKHF